MLHLDPLRRPTVLAAALTLTTPLAAAQSPVTDPLPDIGFGSQSVLLEDVVSTLAFPSSVTAPPDGSPRLFVTEVGGTLRVIEDGALLPTPFLDLSASFYWTNGSAMSAVAFHPDFPVDRRLFVITTEYADPALADFGVTTGVAQQSVLYEVRAAGDWPNAAANQADPASLRELLRINEGSTIHNLDDLAFGPDGYLYLSKGDDLTGGQDLDTIHGSILRIDVDLAVGNAPAANGRYAIPADNPLVGTGHVEELYAWGLRNPWRIAFDGADLWVADVGELTVEEVDRVTAGANLGWPEKEGSFATLPSGGVSDDLSGLPPLPFVDPVGEYDHGQFDTSITGGVVYRGTALPGLVGRYVCADWTSSALFALDLESGGFERLAVDPAGAGLSSVLVGPPFEGVIAVREGADGELLLVVTERSTNPTGRVVRVLAPAWQTFGQALAGGNGEPLLAGSGNLEPGAPGQIALTAAEPLSVGGLFVSPAPNPITLFGGTLVPGLVPPPFVLVTDANGAAALPFTLPTGVPPGLQLWCQAAILDGGAPENVAFTKVLLGTVR